MANALLQSLEPSWSAREQSEIPAWYRERQRRALDAARSASWPDRHHEAWKYTSLHALGQRAAAPATGLSPVAVSDVGNDGLRFIAGRLQAGATVQRAGGLAIDTLAAALANDDQRLRFAIGGEAEGGDVFDLINTAFAGDGAWLRVAPGSTCTDWLRLDMAGSDDASAGQDWHLAHRIEIGEDAQLRLVIDLATAEASSFATLSTRIRLQRNARLDLVWLNAASSDLALIARTRIDLDSDARLNMQVLDAGAAPSRHDLRIALRGEASQSELRGVFLLGERRHADLQLDLRHESPRASSQTVWRAIANERSRAVFDGHITVAAGADGTDAKLACKSLLGSPQAEIDVKPVLEIYADDVKCAHGATVGQLDPQALFYLRTRGLPEAQARELLLSAFCMEALGDGESTPAHQRLREWLGGEG